MFRNITQRFKFLVAFLLLLFVANYIVITLFLEKLREIQASITELGTFTDQVMALETSYTKVRYWEAMSIDATLPDASQQFEANMDLMRRSLDILKDKRVPDDIGSYLMRANTLLTEYEIEFHHLVQGIAERTINETEMNAVFYTLASSSVLNNELRMPLLTINLYRFHYGYLSSRQDSTLQAIQIVLDTLTSHALTLDSSSQEWLERQITRYKKLLDFDFSMDMLLSKKVTDVNMLSAELMMIFSRISTAGNQHFAYKKQNLERIESRMLLTMFMSAALGIMCLSTVLLVVSRNVIRPIHRLHDVVAKVQKGDINARFKPDVDDDINRLGNSFNSMLDTIKNDEDRLYNYQLELESKVSQLSESERESKKQEVHLEDMVQQRTKEISETLEKLRIEVEQRKAVEDQLRLSMHESASASRAKSEFLSTMSHEIRTPLNGIIGMASFLRETELTPEQMEYMDTISQSTSILLGSMNDILDFAKYDSHNFTLESKHFNLHALMEECVELYTMKAREQCLILTAFYDPGIQERFMGDRARVKQIFLTLLSNAVKFTETGEIYLSVTARPTGDNKTRATVLCRDTGIGIPKDKLAALFGPFNQIDSGNTRKSDGIGMGLAICKKLTDLMHGTIHFESKVGSGTTATATFCLDTESEQPAMSPLYRIFKGRTFLIHNPWSLSTECIANHLTFLGGAIRTSSDITSLENALDQDWIDACLLMREGVEKEKIKTLKALIAQRKTPLLVIGQSAGGRPDVDEAGTAEQPIEYIPLPLSIGYMADGLEALFADRPTAVSEHAPSLENCPLSDEYPMRILIVDDDVINQAVFQRYMRQFGYNVDMAENGMIAVEMTKKNHYDVIFMDIRMPVMNGLEAAKEICAHFSKRNRPWIIALTANAMDVDESDCYKAGMQDYISKPYSNKALHTSIVKAWRGLENSRQSTEIT